MAFAAVGSVIAPSETGSSFSLTPSAVNDFILIEVVSESTTVECTALSSSNVSWSVLVAPTQTNGSNFWATVFIGQVTAASAATVTMTFSGTTPTWRALGQEFSTSVGYASITLDSSANIPNAGATALWPSLTPTHSTGELYFGFATAGGTASSGTTSGFTFSEDAHGNGLAFNPSCTSAATAPTWGNAQTWDGVVVMLYEAPPVSLAGISYNTGSTATVNTGATAGGYTTTVPSGVHVGDTVFIAIMSFTFAGAAPVTTCTSSGPSIPTKLTPTSQVLGNAIYATVDVFSFVARSGDAGATLTYGVSGGATNWWFSVGIVAYSGVAAIDVKNSNATYNAAGNGTEVSPSLTTAGFNDWQLQIVSVSPPGGTGSLPTPSGLTNRENIPGNSGLLLNLADSNGSVGPAGTSIGGTSWTLSGGSTGNAWTQGFTIGLLPSQPTVVQTSSTASFGNAATFGSGTKAGNSVVVVITDYNSGGVMTPQPPTLGGSVPNGTFLAKFFQENSAGTQSTAVAIYVMPNVTAGQTAVVGTNMTAGSAASTIAYEVANLGPNPIVDQSAASGAATGTAVSSGATGTTASVAEFVVGGAVGYGIAVATAPSPWVATAGADSGYSNFGYEISSPSGGTYTYSSTATTSGVWAAAVVSIRPAPTTGAYVVQTAIGANGSSATFTNPITPGNSIVLSIGGYLQTTGLSGSTGSLVFNGAAFQGAIKLLEKQAPYGQNGASNGAYYATWLLPFVQAAGTTVSLTATNITFNAGDGIVAYEVGGLGRAPVIDVKNTAASSLGTETTATSGASGTIANALEFVVGGYTSVGVATGDPTSPWTVTDIGADGRMSVGYQIPSSTGTFTYSHAQNAGEFAGGVVALMPSTTYSPVKDSNPANPVIQADTSDYVFGYYFKVSSACYITGIWWFCDVANNQYTNSAGDEQIALWTVTGAGSANENYVAGSVTTAPVYTQGWNFLPFSAPIALSAGTEYMAAKSVNPKTHGTTNGYCATVYAFSTTAPATWQNGAVAGPVTVFSSGLAPTGAANQEPNANGQQAFYSAGSGVANVTSNAPNAASSSTWYGMDVLISVSGSTPPPPRVPDLMLLFF